MTNVPLFTTNPVLCYKINAKSLMCIHVFNKTLLLIIGLYIKVANSKFLYGGYFTLWMKIQLKFEFIAKDSKLKEVIMVMFDTSELIKLVHVNDKPIPGHLVNSLVISYGEIVLSDDAGIRAKRDFYIRVNLHSGISFLRL